MTQITTTIPIKISKRKMFAVVKASGENILEYLQGQITQDIQRLSEQQAIYAAILNPQGKVVTDFHLLKIKHKSSWAEVMFLCQEEYALALVDRLRTFAMGYELRIGKVSSWQVVSVQGEAVDAFLKEKGLPIPMREKLSSLNFTENESQGEISALRMVESAHDGVWLVGADIPLIMNANEDDMEKGRVLQGTPLLGVDWTTKLHPLNANLIEREGVSFDKGCYVGQEVTSRMHWRGGIKKKLYRIALGKAVDMPCDVHTTVKVGEITSLTKGDGNKYVGIALLPVEVVESKKNLGTNKHAPVHILGVCGK